ncbi:hypothetical protein IF803_41320 [Bradyrhizobium sp. UFLA06-06]
MQRIPYISSVLIVYVMRFSREKHLKRRTWRDQVVKPFACAEAHHGLIAGFLFESCSNLLVRLGEVRGNRTTLIFAAWAASTNLVSEFMRINRASFIASSLHDPHRLALALSSSSQQSGCHSRTL